MTIAEKIISIRKKNGLSQTEFAEKLDVSRQSVSKWETGEALPDTSKIISMCSEFGVLADWLIRDDYNEPELLMEENASEENALHFEDSDYETTVEEKPSDNTTDVVSCSKKKKAVIIISSAVALITVLSLIIFTLIPGSYLQNFFKSNGNITVATDEEPMTQAFVLVHGLGGWGSGSGMNNAVKYWGATTGDLQDYLIQQGYEVYTPSIGPVSSTWDRCCELYAILFGGTVDYGEYHSAQHNHNRYGRTYKPMIDGFGERIASLNLIGHSFGGETVRMFTSLLAYGDLNEIITSGENISPLFTGGKSDYIHSVTTLCSPHNGSSLTCVLDSIGNIGGIEGTTSLVASLCFATAGLAVPVSGAYDFMLDQFDIGAVNGGLDEIINALDAFMSSGNDHAGYDLSPDGAATLHNEIKMVDSVYYFSYSFSITRKSSVLYTQVPKNDILPVLYPFALSMGCYNGKTQDGIVIDEKWLENDGLVNVISAKAPFNDPQTELISDIATTSDLSMIESGIWNIAPVREGDHGTVIGLNTDTEKTHSFYINLFTCLENLQ